MAAFTSFLPFPTSYSVQLLLKPLLLPLYTPWPGYFQGCPGFFPSLWLPACCRHVTRMLQACYRHGHFHLAAYATQVRW